MRRRFIIYITFLSITLLIVDPVTGISGARDGIELCYRSVIASLFPFMFLITIIAGQCSFFKLPFLQPLCERMGIPIGCESILVLSWLGGYPVGARCIYENYRNGQLSKSTANRILSFCNNAGPSFIFGILSSIFTSSIYLWLLWFTQIFSSILTGILIPKREKTEKAALSIRHTTIMQAFSSSMNAIGAICGWVVLFRLAISYGNKWLLHLLPTIPSVILTGILELTNGCFSLAAVHNENTRFIICNTLLSFGGLCVVLQTKSVAGKLCIGQYFLGKVLQCSITFLLSLLFVFIFF